MVKKIIKEAMEQNPLGLKEAVAEELRARVALALEAKIGEMSGLEEAEQIDELDKKTLTSYVKKSEKDSKRLDKAMAAVRKPSSRGGENIGALYSKKQNRETGIERAKERLAKESVDLEEAKMTDAEVLSAAKALTANGKDEKTKAFGKGLVDFYKKEGSFTPAQVGGLQNIMKNASFQMAKESVELDEAEAQTTYRVGGFYTHRGDDKPVSIKVSAASEAEAKQKAKDQLSGNHKNYRATTVKVV